MRATPEQIGTMRGNLSGDVVPYVGDEQVNVSPTATAQLNPSRPSFTGHFTQQLCLSSEGYHQRCQDDTIFDGIFLF